MQSAPCLLTVHAHPDDESSKGAATVAHYHALGVRTVLVCCTGGEEGDILNPRWTATYADDEGSSQHPDHRRAHEISVAAFDRAGDAGCRIDLGAPWTPTKLYYSMRSRHRIAGRHAAFLELGLESPYDDVRLERPAQDDRITTRIPIDGYMAVRLDALRAHASQIDPLSARWFGLPDDVEHSIHPFDDYALARGPQPAVTPEPDLFAGIGGLDWSTASVR